VLELAGTAVDDVWTSTPLDVWHFDGGALESGRKLLGEALEEATATIQNQRAELDRLTAVLLERESLERDGLTAILGRRSSPAGEAAHVSH